MIHGENESGTVDDCHAEAHIWEIRVPIFLIACTGKLVLNVGAESVALVILVIMFSY